MVTPFFPSEGNFRGSFIYDQARSLQRHGKEVLVFMAGVFEPYEFEGIKVRPFRHKELPSYLFNGFYNSVNGSNFIRALLAAGIRPEDVSVVHCHTSTFGACGLALKRLNPNVKFLLQHHDKDPYMIRNGKLAGWYPNRWYRAYKSIKLFNEVDCHVCISDAVADNLLAFPNAGRHEAYPAYLKRLKKLCCLPRVGIKRWVKLYNGVDTTKFYKICDMAKSSKFVIGCVANFVELKHQLDLIKAVEQLVGGGLAEGIGLRLVGSGPTKIMCEEYVNTHNLAKYVSFEKEVGHAALNEFYNSLDLFVLPSVFEGFGCVCTEAAAAGVPYIICKHQGAAEYIAPEQQDLWTYEPGDVRALSGLILRRRQEAKPQKLIHPVNIDTLIGAFLKDIGE